MDYLCVTGGTTPRARAQAMMLLQAAQAHGLPHRPMGRSGWLACGGPRPPRVVKAGLWTLIGDVFDRRQGPLSRFITGPDDHACEQSIMRRFWGRYVGLRVGPNGRIAGLLRDPSGALECIAWEWRDLVVVSSDLPEWLVSLTRPDWRIAFDRVGRALQDPLGAWWETMIDGPTVLPPGAVQPFPSSVPPVSSWRPDIFARASDEDVIPDKAASAALRNAVDEAVHALAGDGRLAAELSGGLDSAIVGSSLRASGRDAGAWLHAFGEEPGGDERAYAHAMAAKLGVVLTTLPRAPGPLTERMLLDLTPGLRPGLNGMDAPNDAIWARVLKQGGSNVLLTGKGGDAVFIQGAGADVFCDIWRRRGWRAALSSSLPNLARWNGCSVWSLIAAARLDGPDRPRLGRSVSFVSGDVTPSIHPWLDAASDLGPAKRYQIAGVINGVTFSGPSLQSQTVELVHPLLAQPVVETCLALSAEQLTLGRRDRALARETFRDRLTPEIAERRSKGEMTAYYGRRLAMSLNVIRPWLLDGRLASEGLIVRETVEALLTEDSLIWRGRVGEIMTAVVIEAWVRTWEARLAVR
ncbi:asparagine synthase-related protein [Brevundimonas naejangsanensis]|uniref:asparagine synthase-related protein n=1 Tax=Brevundimonas naejangsanensis TaxID=588932 RepID=UPI003D17BB7F